MASSDRQKRQNYDQRPRRELAKLSKLVFDDLTPRSYDRKGERKTTSPPLDYLQQISDRTASVTNDLESMKQLLPDLELASQILVSSILSPKEMSNPELSFMFNSSFEDEELGARLIEVIKNYFENEWEINEELSDILYDILFRKGAFIRLIVPESSVDEIINDNSRLSLESMRSVINPSDMSARPLGLLGQPKGSEETEQRFTMESVGFSKNAAPPKYSPIGSYIHIVDNPDAVKMPKFLERHRRDVFRQAYNHFSLEQRAQKKKDERKKAKEKKRKDKDKDEAQKIEVTGKTDREIDRTLRQNRRFEREQIVAVKTRSQSERDPIGHPMTIEVDTEAVIPAHAPSSPDEHIGYFILLDQYGYPISASTAVDHYRDLQREFNRSRDENSVERVLQEMRGNQQVQSGNTRYESLAQATNAFASIVEKDLTDRLRQGGAYVGAEIEHVDEVYQIMLARACRKKHTQILFVPAELVSYMAFYYNHQGVGESLLEKSRILGSVRVLLMFANTMAAIQNATSRTNVKVQLDPNDSDPMSTIDIVRDSIIRSRNEQYPLGEADPSAMLSYLQRAGISVSYSGHDALPEMDVDIQGDRGEKNTVDRDLEENLRHSHIMSLGLSPETVDVSRGVDFATSLVQSSLLLNKRVSVYQKKFERQLVEFVRKYTYNSEELTTQLLEIIEDHGKNIDPQEQWRILEDFLDAIYLHLPKPDTVSLESQMEAFEQYSRGLQDAIEAWVDDNFVQDELYGEIARNIREFKEAIYAYYIRRWLRENNVFPELEELTQKDHEGNLDFDFAHVHNEHMSSIMEHLENYHELAKYSTAEREKKREELHKKLKEKYGFDPDAVADDAQSDQFGSDTSQDTGSDDDTGTDAGGGFDFDDFDF